MQQRADWDVVLLTRLETGSNIGGLEVFKVFSDIKYLFTAPLILGMLFVINLATSPGDWWVQWAALGMGIAWVVCLLRVIRAVIVVGGLAALGTWLWKRESAGRNTGTTPPQGTDSVEQV